MKFLNLVFFVCVAALGAMFFMGKGSEPVPVQVPLDFSRPIYTTANTVVCPDIVSLDFDKTGGTYDVIAAMLNHNESVMEKLGCEEWVAGVKVAATPQAGDDKQNGFSFFPNPYTGVGLLANTDALTNDPKGIPQYETAGTAPKPVQASPKPSPETVAPVKQPETVVPGAGECEGCADDGATTPVSSPENSSTQN